MNKHITLESENGPKIVTGVTVAKMGPNKKEKLINL